MTRSARSVLVLLFVSTVIGVTGCSNAKTLIYEDNQQIWKSYTDGSGKTSLASKGEYPSWIPGTKTHIAYVERKPNSEMMKLWKADEDGKNPIALSGFDVHYDYSWSPDGKSITVAKWVNNNYDIFKIPVNGSSPVPLTNNTFWDQYPAWSPKVDKIAFISGRPGKVDYGIFLINADGTGEKRLTNNTVKVHGSPDGRLTWSWDGTLIAFVGRWGTRKEIATVDVATGKTMQLTSPATNPGVHGCYDPHWFSNYLFYICGNGMFRRDMNTGTASKLGSFVWQIEHSRPSANTTHVFFSYGPSSKIVSIQHHTGAQASLGAGESPAVWEATLPLVP